MIVPKFLGLGLIVLTIASLHMPCFAQTKASKWQRVLPSDVRNSENWAFRKTNKALNLSAFGDFDGDGQQDEAYLAKNEAANEYAVFVKTAKAGAEPVRLETGKLSDLQTIGLTAVKPGRYTDWCAGKTPRPDTCAASVEVPNEAFSLFQYESSARILYSKNGKWLTVWVSD